LSTPTPSRRRSSRTLRALLAAAVAVVAVAGARAARAQLLEPPRSRQGYYFALGYQLALSHPTEDGESWGVWPGGNLSIRFGQLITRRFGLGLQINSGSTSGQGQKAAAGGLELEAQWELARNLAAYGGVGSRAAQWARVTRWASGTTGSSAIA
jgi:hypothetical protein